MPQSKLRIKTSVSKGKKDSAIQQAQNVPVDLKVLVFYGKSIQPAMNLPAFQSKY